MEKKWYKVSFFAPMTADDVKAMNGSFYAAMEEMMNIYGCEGLDIKEDRTQQRLDYEDYEDGYDEESNTLSLREGDYILDPRTGDIQIDTLVFDRYTEGKHINICFVDEEDQPVSEYMMYRNDGDWIFCEFIKAIG